MTQNPISDDIIDLVYGTVKDIYAIHAWKNPPSRAGVKWTLQAIILVNAGIRAINGEVDNGEDK